MERVPLSFRNAVSEPSTGEDRDTVRYRGARELLLAAIKSGGRIDIRSLKSRRASYYDLEGSNVRTLMIPILPSQTPIPLSRPDFPPDAA